MRAFILEDSLLELNSALDYYMDQMAMVSVSLTLLISRDMPLNSRQLLIVILNSKPVTASYQEARGNE